MPPRPPQEQVKFWRDPALNDLELLRARYVTHSFCRHTHDSYAIGVIEAGVEEFTYRGAMHRAPAGSVVVIHPGEVHTGHAGIPSGWAYRMLYPNTSLMQRAGAELVGDKHLPFFADPVMADPWLAQQLRQLHQVIETSASALERESCFVWTLAQLIGRHGDRPPPPSPQPPSRSSDIRLVRDLQDYLDAHLADNITLEQLARQFHLKPLRLLRLFRRVVGLPPHAYLVQQRIEQAKLLLRLGLPIVQVAADTGFADQSHLNRHFKRLMGITPRQYALGGCKNVQDFGPAPF